VATNVPYLGRSKQSEILRDFSEAQHADAKSDLATAFFDRMRQLVPPQGRLLGRRHNRIRRLPPPLSAWTVSRDAPRPPTQSFRDWWTEQDRS